MFSPPHPDRVENVSLGVGSPTIGEARIKSVPTAEPVRINWFRTWQTLVFARPVADAVVPSTPRRTVSVPAVVVGAQEVFQRRRLEALGQKLLRGLVGSHQGGGQGRTNQNEQEEDSQGKENPLRFTGRYHITSTLSI